MVGKDVLATPNIRRTLTGAGQLPENPAGVVNLILIIASSLTINL